VVAATGATAQSLTVGSSGTGMLTIGDGGTASSSSGLIGQAGRGTVTVCPAGAGRPLKRGGAFSHYHEWCPVGRMRFLWGTVFDQGEHRTT